MLDLKIGAVVLALAVAACGGAPALTITTTATELPVPRGELVTPTVTTTPESGPTPTATPTAEPALPTPRETATPIDMSPSPTSTPAPTATRVAPSPTPRPAGGIPQVEFVPAYPSLPKAALGPQPLYYAFVPDGSGRVVVLDQNGKISIFQNDPQVSEAEIFLDLTEKVSTRGNEEGLLGLAFHPRFKTNGTFFVYYSAADPRRSVLSRFTVTGDPDRADPASELVILEVPQPFSNHNGGMLAFGPDGFLYVALGDGGGGGDPDRNGQNLATLLGAILRIDVDHARGDIKYAIPSDNPFAGRPANEARHEIWTYGLRNPWRFSFDRASGNLWAGDVGQNSWEEIDLIVKGANYGWNIMEGAHCFRAESCDQTGLVLPIAEYRTQLGCSVIGGYVYRGKLQPALEGVYIYADFCAGLVWGLRHDGENLAVGPKLIAESGLFISSFGEDEDGELYVTSFGGPGRAAGVYRLVVR